MKNATTSNTNPGREALSSREVAMTFAQYQAAVARTGDIYVACPACSGTRKSTFPSRPSDEVFSCQSCGAIFGRVSSAYDYVEKGLVNGEATRYFDFTQRSTGLRIHGWADEKGRVVQYG
jgi:uncharacterized C2H2 Zn-finger protein